MPEPDRPRTAAEYARLQEAYGGKYVATRGDEVIASADKYSDLARALDERDDYTEDVVVQYVRPKGAIFAY